MANEDSRGIDGTAQRPRGRALALAGLGTLITVVGTLVNWATGPRGLMIDVLLVGLCSSALIYFGQGLWLRYTPWMTAGALLGASLVSVLKIAPWPFAAALAFAAAGLINGRSRRPRLPALMVLVAVSAVVNASLVWVPVIYKHWPASAAEFEAKELRMHTLVSDVPLYDVWVAHLPGGPTGLTMLDVRWLLVDGFRHNRLAAYIAVAAARGILGHLFGWDSGECHDPAISYTHRLSAADRERSLTTPGDSLFVYTFEQEALLELTNCTVHAFIGMALEPEDDGYTIHWAFYVKRVGWITPFYMALIQPFRHFIVYPSTIQVIEDDWSERWNR